MDRFASFEAEGDEPGGRGEQLANAYITSELQSMGWTVQSQSMPLVELAFESSPLTVTGGKGARTLRSPDDYVAWTRHDKPDVSVDAEMVFVGYGVAAPEFSWDDYKNIDVAGKVVVVLIGGPHVGTRQLLGKMGPAYYGRAEYKFEEAARRGAAGALVIHEPDQTGYPWDLVRRSSTARLLQIDWPENNSAVPIQGWLTHTVAGELITGTGNDFEQLKKRAELHNFTPVPLGIKASGNIKVTRRSLSSTNVVGLLEGPLNEYVIYVSRWNHLESEHVVGGDESHRDDESDPPSAVPVLEIARALAREPRRMRSFVFLNVTAEPEGLLGADYYAANPIFPIDKTVALLHLEGSDVHGVNRQISMVGSTFDALRDVLRGAASESGRIVVPEHDAAKIAYYLQTQFSYTRRHVPSLIASSTTSTEIGLANTQQSPPSEAPWSLLGVVLDARLLFDVGLSIANSNTWPKWTPRQRDPAKR